MRMILEPQDVLFFRDAIPMAAGVGKGHGCRMPMPGEYYEALRSALLPESEKSGGRNVESVRTRRRDRITHGSAKSAPRLISSAAFQSLRTNGPYPWLKGLGALFPAPMDISLGLDGTAAECSLLPDERCMGEGVDDYSTPCIAVSNTPPRKGGKAGWWSAEQWKTFINGGTKGLSPTRADSLWAEEDRIGVELSDVNGSAEDGQLFSGSVIRPVKGFALAAEAVLAQPMPEEVETMERLDVMMFGGESRMARILAEPWNFPVRPTDSGGSCLVSWTLLSPAVFANGWLPGWVCPNAKPDGKRVGEVRLRLASGRAWLAAVCAGRPVPFSGWDMAGQRPKPTRLAVPAGSVYHFLAETPEAATELAGLLHGRPRSDESGERGFGYGVCHHRARTHKSSKLSVEKLIEKLR